MCCQSTKWLLTLDGIACTWATASRNKTVGQGCTQDIAKSNADFLQLHKSQIIICRDSKNHMELALGMHCHDNRAVVRAPRWDTRHKSQMCKSLFARYRAIEGDGILQRHSSLEWRCMPDVEGLVRNGCNTLAHAMQLPCDAMRKTCNVSLCVLAGSCAVYLRPYPVLALHTVPWLSFALPLPRDITCASGAAVIIPVYRTQRQGCEATIKRCVQ